MTEAKQHSRLFWIKELNKLLFDPRRPDAAKFEGYIKDYLRWELMQMLPSIMRAPSDDGSLAILTYYSTFVASSTQIDADFLRIPISTLKLNKTDRSSLDTQEQAFFLSRIEQARTFAEKCLTGTLLKLGAESTGQSDPHSEEIDTFLKEMQKDVLAPVNLAEALNVDFHLPEGVYKQIADQKLFGREMFDMHEKDGARVKANALRRWAELDNIHSARKDPKVGLDLPLFTSVAMGQAREAVKTACRRLRELPSQSTGTLQNIKASQDIMNELVKAIQFRFEEEPKDADIPAKVEAIGDSKIQLRLTGSQLKELAIQLLTCEPEMTGKDEVSLYDLWTERSQGSPTGSKLSTVPSLPFFLLALLWEGTYRDLIRYLLPPFLLNVRALYIETVDLCGSPADLLYQLSSYLMDLEDTQQVEEGSFASNVSRMIGKNAIGNLAVLRTADVISDSIGWVSELDSQLRASVNPVRRRERYAEIRDKRESMSQMEKQRAKELGAAFHDLVQPTDALGAGIAAIEASVRKVSAGSVDMSQILENIIDCHKHFDTVATTIKAQMSFANNEPEELSNRTYDVFMLRDEFSDLDRWQSLAESLWSRDMCNCQPYIITPDDDTGIHSLKLPLRSLKAITVGLLRNLIRYGDFQRSAEFINRIHLDTGEISLAITNGIPEQLDRNRREFKNQRRSLLSETRKDEQVDFYLGKDWLKRDSGSGMRGILNNYLIRNFSSDPVKDLKRFEKSDMRNLSYHSENDLGTVSLNIQEEPQDAGRTYYLTLKLRLPDSFVEASVQM